MKLIDEQKITQKGKRTKNDIFNAFVSLVVKNGYDGVSIRDIASEVGIREASIYYYFPSKIDMLIEVFEYFKMNVTRTLIDEKTLNEMIDTRGGYITLQSCLIEFKKIMESGFMYQAWRIIHVEQFRNSEAHEIIAVNLNKMRIDFYERLFLILMQRRLIAASDPNLLAREHYYSLISMFDEYSILRFYEKRTHIAEKRMFEHIEFFWNKIKN